MLLLGQSLILRAVRLAPLGLKAPPVQLGPPALQAWQVRRVQLDRQEQRDYKVRPALPVLRVRRGVMAMLVLPARRALQVHRVPLARKAP